MRVVTLNLWNVNPPWPQRRAVINEQLDLIQPDLVLLQEVSRDVADGRLQSDQLYTQEQTLVRHYQRTGYWRGREEGLAILSTLQLRSISSTLLPEVPDDMPRQVLCADVINKGKRLRVANTHWAFAVEDDEGRRRQAEATMEYLAALEVLSPADGIVLAGDFNASPNSSAIETILRAPLALRDAFAQQNSVPGRWTFSSQNPYVHERLTPNRWIDHAFVSSSLSIGGAVVILDHAVNGIWASDHFGLCVDVEFNE